MADETKKIKKFNAGSPSNRMVLMGNKSSDFGLNTDEKKVILYIRDHGGRVPLEKVKETVEVSKGDAASIIDNLKKYNYAMESGNKIILTNEGEYISHFMKMAEE